MAPVGTRLQKAFVTPYGQPRMGSSCPCCLIGITDKNDYKICVSICVSFALILPSNSKQTHFHSFKLSYASAGPNIMVRQPFASGSFQLLQWLYLSNCVCPLLTAHRISPSYLLPCRSSGRSGIYCQVSAASDLCNHDEDCCAHHNDSSRSLWLSCAMLHFGLIV